MTRSLRIAMNLGLVLLFPVSAFAAQLPADTASCREAAGEETGGERSLKPPFSKAQRNTIERWVLGMIEDVRPRMDYYASALPDIKYDLYGYSDEQLLAAYNLTVSIFNQYSPNTGGVNKTEFIAMPGDNSQTPRAPSLEVHDKLAGWAATRAIPVSRSHSFSSTDEAIDGRARNLPRRGRRVPGL